MSSHISNAIVKFLYKDIPLSDKEYNIYTFCLEFIIDNLFFVTFTIGVSIFFSNIFCSVTFLIILYDLRPVTGGYHAKSKLICTVFSYLFSFISMVYVPNLNIPIGLHVLIYTLSTIILIILGPVSPAEKAIKNTADKRRLLTIILCINTLLFIFSYFTMQELIYIISEVTFVVCLSNVIGVCINRRKNEL